jgi:TonB family protein
MRFGLIACLVWLMLAAAPTGALGQEGAASADANAVLAHFRAYRAGRDAGDGETAEREAEAALTASEAKDGDGGVTPVLVMNLALTRLDRLRFAEALAPAQRAYDFAFATPPAQGLDPLLAKLALGRALVGAESQRGAGNARGAELLMQALAAGQTRSDIEHHLYTAARELGGFQFRLKRWAAARDAFAEAERHAAGAPAAVDVADAEMQIMRAGALVFLDQEPEAMAVLHDASKRLEPFVDQLREDGELTYTQSVYAMALAWQGVAYARMSRRQRAAERAQTPEQTESRESEPMPLVAGALAPTCCCPLHVVARPLPTYPTAALEYNGIGTIVLRVRFRENGEVIDRRVAAALPPRYFQEAVERVMDRWQFVRDADAPPDCTFPPQRFIPIRFVLS